MSLVATLEAMETKPSTVLTAVGCYGALLMVTPSFSQVTRKEYPLSIGSHIYTPNMHYAVLYILNNNLSLILPKSAFGSKTKIEKI